MPDSRQRGTLTGHHAGGGRNGLRDAGYDVHLVHDADDAAADEAIVKSQEMRQQAMDKLGVTQADIDEARAAKTSPQPRRVSRGDVVLALAPVLSAAPGEAGATVPDSAAPASDTTIDERCPHCEYLVSAPGHAVTCG